jgi:osmoprotectant transport system permease protein
MTLLGEAFPSRGSASAAEFVGQRVDKLGVVLAALAAVGLLFQPFATLKANRIVSGKALGVFDALPGAIAAPLVALILAAVLLALLRTRPTMRLAVGASALVGVLVVIGFVPAHLVSLDNPLARVAPASGFWILVFAFTILITDPIAKLNLGPSARVAALAAAAMIVGGILMSGLWSGLSVMKEYATHADSFWQDGARHVELSLSSLALAVLVGLPLGIACQRAPTLRDLALPVLSIIQTIPSIAMFGLMMAPLGLLAARFPLLGQFGIRGIGAAPAMIALFLYSLLPVVANVVVGLQQISAGVVEAARGMGMTERQRLLRVELPLAAPFVLTGVRVVLVQNIGLVTVAALIGGGGFGEFVFQGLGQSATDLVLLGAVPTIALAFVGAILMDALVEFIAGRRR